jgi:hypothetical protein
VSHASILFQEVARERDQDTRQRDAGIADRLLEQLYPVQRAFVKDRCRHKAALCPRRAGKSYTALAYALILCLTRPGAKCLILARVRRQAKGVYWRPLKKLCADFEVKAHFRNMELECELDNGSTILFAGADTQEETDKYRGQDFDLVILDEGKSYSARLLDELITDILDYTLLDRMGTLAIVGTPGAILAGPFYAVTAGDLSVIPKRERWKWTARFAADGEKQRGHRWSVHTWTTKDNTECPWIWETVLAEKEEHGIPDDDPTFLREGCGKWVPDDDALVFAYTRVQDERCDWAFEGDGPHGLPEGHEWRFVLGLDFGYVDDTAFVVGAWSPTHPSLFFVHAEKHSQMLPEDIAQRVRELEQIYGVFDTRVADSGGLGKTILEALSRTYGIPCIAARKRDKCDHIKLLNSDILAGRVRLDPSGPLAEEWRTAQWADAEHSKVDPACDDHASDAALYLWRYVFHHLAREREVELEEGSPDWWKAREAAEEEKYRQQLVAERETPWWKKLISRNSASW